MAKPTNPNITIPAAFATNGAKTDFPAERITNGFDEIAPEILAGDNFNKLVDDTYKGLTYAMAGVTDLYKSAIQYDSTETYDINSLVFNVDNNGNTTFYRSVIANNAGYPLNNTNYWVQVQLGADILNIVMPIGKPQLSLDNSLPTNCIWLEGATVSRTTYSKLFNIWGTTYGAGDGSTTFVLPDARKRAFYGDTSFGYITQGLPDLGLAMTTAGGHNHNRGDMNITGNIYIAKLEGQQTVWGDGAFYHGGQYEWGQGQSGLAGGNWVARGGFDASRSWTGNTSWNGDHTHSITSSSGLIGATNKILTDGLKVRVYCRYQ